MPGLHAWDLFIVVGLALLFFGPKKLPEMGSAVGKTIKEFQKSMREVTHPGADAPSAALPAAVVRPAEPPQLAAPAAPSTPGTPAPAAGAPAEEPATAHDTVAG